MGKKRKELAYRFPEKLSSLLEKGGREGFLARLFKVAIHVFKR
jgi:hypothetical protein